MEHFYVLVSSFKDLHRQIVIPLPIRYAVPPTLARIVSWSHFTTEKSEDSPLERYNNIWRWLFEVKRVRYALLTAREAFMDHSRTKAPNDTQRTQQVQIWSD